MVRSNWYVPMFASVQGARLLRAGFDDDFISIRWNAVCKVPSA
jgi:hypothetical protein